ncbi:helix-turn-helix transcriptional regulator [Sphingopyxis sp. OPL5]|jgi:DNA-binding CsgD family transcriptional regulator|uniref:response regulator transcription factor n=1 Tax=unclassified Sphingopyxis TaxID=2614943 RepID=UPI0006FD542D|nr:MULTISPECIES: helix-turn-helix transcriptional regulator [unclassified Sphingopyxis]KQZ60804.1 LuxR family transcriptional regulator [Sphingopyxis sp. Root1497]OHD03398.1 MAG: helix-turn-helix transcriptional regulator [Sphingopyxis sp. RIFCSPHIGHO2_01_FULL_65_24]QNO28145.1 helix-turn-helix transcriptional regulator [Sphingopyxis sp. OPL5]
MYYSRPVQGDPDNYISLLSAAQIETLRHVFEHKNSKEIARLMNVSPHTVDERVRRSLKKLNVSNRVEAATILARNGVFEDVTPYQPLTYQPVNLSDSLPADEGDPGHGSFRQIFNIGLPFPTKSQPINRHGLLERIIWPILIAFVTILAFSALYSILVGLGRLT